MAFSKDWHLAYRFWQASFKQGVGLGWDPGDSLGTSDTILAARMVSLIPRSVSWRKEIS